MPVRYTVVPQNIQPALPGWASGERVTSVDVGPDFKYALRLSRTGYIYLFYDKNMRGNNQWECYSVGQDGSLTRFLEWRHARPQETPVLHCARHGPVNTQVHYLVIEQPEKCGATWIAFSQDKWSEETVDEYTTNTKLRNARMQTFHPAKMIAGTKHSHGAIATKKTLEQVQEYSQTLSTSLLPNNAIAGDISSEDGKHNADRLKQMSTRYPWALRPHKAEETAKHMLGRAKDVGGKQGTAHVLALWDAIGIAHELNGFRNDAAGWITKYGNERSLQLTTLSAIDGVRKTLESNAGALSDHMIERTRALPNLSEESENRARNRLRIDPSDKGAQKELDDALAERAKRQQTSRQGAEDFKRTNIANAWPRYYAKLDKNALADFEKKSKQFFVEADTLINQRTLPLIKWLEATLLIDTLEDFHKKNIGDGLLFEDVVGDACFGMGSCDVGETKIDEWVKQDNSLFWRAIALNQQEGIEQVDAALAHAKSGKNTVLTAESWAAVAAGVKWNKLGDVYKKAQSFANNNIRAIDSKGAVKEAKGLGFLKIFAGMGDRVLPAFAAKRFDGVISEKVFQSLFLLRAGAHVDDVMGLVREQAAVESIDRFAMLRRIQTAEVFANSMQDSSGRWRPNAEALRQKWANLAKNVDTAGSDGRFNAAKDSRLALVVAVLEAFNLAKTGYDASVKQDAKSMLVLGSAVASLTAAATDVYTNVVKGALEETSLTFQRLKFVGGVLGGGASIGGSISTWVDGQKYKDAGQANLYRWAMTNFVAGALGSAFGTAATLSYCGPWLVAVAEKQSAKRIAIAGATRLAAAAATRLAVYRAVLMGAGLALNLISLSIQFAIWYLTDDELQSWCEKCPFGQKRESKWTVEKMIEELYKATYAVGVQA